MHGSNRYYEFVRSKGVSERPSRDCHERLHSGIASTQNAATAAANECTSSTKCKEVDEVWRKATPHAAHYIVGRSLAYGATAPSRPVNSADTFPPRTDPSHFRSDPAHNVSIFAQN